MKRTHIAGFLFILLSLCIISVSAFVYETAQHTITQTIKEITTLAVQNSDLGNIEEGETKSYNKTTVASLGNIINITTTKDNVYLHINSNLDSLSTYYTTYTVTVKFAAVGSGSSHNVGDTACTISLTSPDPPAINLDKAGTWRFDFEILTTAKSVSADQPTTVTIIVTAEST
ncbi:MAG: hypothetical protein QXZ25_04805 [Candidatus Bathyarchaeia archaeon]